MTQVSCAQARRQIRTTRTVSGPDGCSAIDQHIGALPFPERSGKRGLLPISLERMLTATVGYARR